MTSQSVACHPSSIKQIQLHAHPTSRSSTCKSFYVSLPGCFYSRIEVVNCFDSIMFNANNFLKALNAYCLQKMSRSPQVFAISIFSLIQTHQIQAAVNKNLAALRLLNMTSARSCDTARRLLRTCGFDRRKYLLELHALNHYPSCPHSSLQEMLSSKSLTSLEVFGHSDES